MTLQLGMVGAGRSGVKQAAILKSYPDVDITAIAEPSRPARDAFARKFHTHLAVSDHRRLASDPAVDVVYICSPPATHSTIAVDCLNAGKHVICEPPMAVTTKQADEMIAASQTSGKRLFIALPQRYNPVCQLAAKLIEDGKIGYPFMALATYVKNEYDRMEDWHDWKGTWDMAGGGVLMENGSEIIDMLCYLFGKVDAASAVCTRFAVDALNKAEDSSLLDLEFVEDVSVQFALTGAARYSTWPEKYTGDAMRLDIYGVEGAIGFTSYSMGLNLSTKEDHNKFIPISEIETGHPTDMIRDFLDSILEDKDPWTAPKQARDALKVVIAAYKSSQMKRRVETLEEL